MDLSECIISPAQIEQALGHQPTMEEMKKLMAPKSGKAKNKRGGFDFEEFLRGGRSRLDFDARGASVDTKELIESGKKLYKELTQKEEKKETKEDNTEEVRKSIEQYKREVLEQRKEQQEQQEKTIEQRREQIEETKALINAQKQKGLER